MLENDLIHTPLRGLRRLALFVLTAAVAGAGIALMWRILSANGMALLEWATLPLFAVTFAWISLAFVTAIAGFVLKALRLDPLSLKRQSPQQHPPGGSQARVAVVMPICNEDTPRVLAGVEAHCHELAGGDMRGIPDFFVLSDTRDEAIAEREASGVAALAARLQGTVGLYYRRRVENKGRKAGNIADFCERWGGAYDYMITLDADSVMTGDAMGRLVRAMDANPRAGIIQTVPIPVRQATLFGRCQQFAAALYSPMLATGLAFWQTDTANYWGHNAILRIDAFMAHCELPRLRGRPPLGGEILSHDFVEAALMRRGGWKVYLLPHIGGSYEEMPSNLLDFAKRDRRWAQGNLQHLRLVPAQGLHPLNRLYFIMGALAYLCSFLWLAMLVVGTADAISRAVVTPQFFAAGSQLFPDWPRAQVPEMVTLLVVVAIMLFLPKVLGVLVAVMDPERRRGFGGGIRLAISAFLETLFSVLIAPVMMSFHAYFVAAVLLGRNVRWTAQSRDGREVSTVEAVRSTLSLTLVAILWGLLTAWLVPLIFFAMSPVLIGLLFAIPLVVVSSRVALGNRLGAHDLLVVPTELGPPAVLRIVESAEPLPAANVPAPELPPDAPAAMAVQDLTRGSTTGMRWLRRRML